MESKLVKLCGLYENTSKATGKRYLTGNLSLTAKLLVLENRDRKAENEPSHFLFVTEQEPKPPATAPQDHKK